jgi:hypothetical protein
LVPLAHQNARVHYERFHKLEAKALKPEKDISRMSDKRLKYRYGESGGTDKVAEDELRRRGLTDRQIRGVIHGYRQGEYTPKGGPYEHPDKSPTEEQAPPDEATEPKAAVDKEPIMHHGPFKGWPLAKVPEWHLEWCYASFTKGRKHFEKELRSRGYHDRDFKRCKRQHPVLGKSPKKQGPKD